MEDVAGVEFPFVQSLPKREKSKLAKVWDLFNEARRISQEKGLLVPATLAATLCDVSRNRIYELMQDGRLDRIELNGHVFVTEQSLVAWAATERKAGRPVKQTLDRDIVRAAWRAGQVVVEKS